MTLCRINGDRRTGAWALCGALVLAGATSGCAGSIDGASDPRDPGSEMPGSKPGDSTSPGGTTNPGGTTAATAATAFGGGSGLRRLTRLEYDNTLRDLLGDTSRAGFAKLPEDANDPFDNDYTTQNVSGALIVATETLAQEAATRAVSDAARRTALLGCTPTGPDDGACLRTFITRFGRRAFRRPLTAAEIDGYLGLRTYAVENKNFYSAVELVLRAVLQDANFLYRVELGEPVANQRGVYRLNDFEIGTRMSYFLWGTTPSDALLALAEGGKLQTAAGRREAAAMLIQDARGRDRVNWFHAFWLGYHQLPFAADLAAQLRAESDALVQKVVFGGKQDYLSLLTTGETFLTSTLAQHYGLPAPGTAVGAWVPYGASGRKGILSHGSVLSVGAKFDDTSPTLRGVFVRNRLLCQDVPPPPPNVDVDQPPTATTSRCKAERYKAHTQGGCAGCHSQIDPIGFGLENFDRAGKYRTAEKDAPECTIAGEGNLAGLGNFKGPAGLSALLLQTGGVESCVVRQLHHFASGRREEAMDTPVLDALTDGFKKNGRAFDQLLLDVVASTAFAHRRVVE